MISVSLRACRLLDPVRPEQRELLALGIAGLEREAPCHHAEILAPREERKNVAPWKIATSRWRPPWASPKTRKPGKPEIRQGRGHRQAAVVELAAVVDDAAHGPVLDDEQSHRAHEREAAVERLNGETAPFLVPEHRVGLCPDCHILIVGSLLNGSGSSEDGGL